jgi:L-threonylcarbamoyladenylate synthase
MSDTVVDFLKNDGIGILPTDTIYGIVGSAFSKKAVDRVFHIKKRDKNKSLIILISSISDLENFGVEMSNQAKIFIKKFWPGKVSVIFNFDNQNLSYLDRDNSGTLAFRLPDKKDLVELLQKTGPLVAPSANLQGMETVKNIIDAKKGFSDKVDFYIDGGELLSGPSTIVKIVGDKIKIIREGAVKIV